MPVANMDPQRSNPVTDDENIQICVYVIDILCEWLLYLDLTFIRLSNNKDKV